MATKPTKPAPAAKGAAPAAPEGAPVAAPKSKKMLIIIIVVLLLVIAAGAGWFFAKGHAPEGEHAEAPKVEVHTEPKFVPMGDNFTVNLQREDGADQYLQAGITLKILQPELEEKIKAAMPEIRSKLLFLLSSKLPSELQTAEGKKKLIAEIIAETDSVLGVAPARAAASAPAAAAHDGHEAAASAAEAVSAPAATQAAPAHAAKTTGVVDVLFTSFIIQ